MEPRAHHVLIGLFAIVTLGGILLFALWLSKSSAERDYDYYEIRFDQGVSGLAVGNAVQYNGIKVGDVVDLSLDPKDPSQVRALIRVYSDVPVKRDTRAGLMLANVTGSMSIQLYGGTPQSPRLVSDPDQPAVIVAEPSPLRTFLADGETLMSSLDQLLNNTNRLLSPENIGRIERILADIEQITTTLVAQRGEFAQAVTNFNRVGQHANALLEQQGSGAFNSMQHAMAALERSSSQIELLLAGNAASVNQGLSQLGPALSELNSVLNHLNQITRRLEENPSDYLFNRDTIEGFSP